MLRPLRCDSWFFITLLFVCLGIDCAAAEDPSDLLKRIISKCSGQPVVIDTTDSTLDETQYDILWDKPAGPKGLPTVRFSVNPGDIATDVGFSKALQLLTEFVDEDRLDNAIRSCRVNIDLFNIHSVSETPWEWLELHYNAKHGSRCSILWAKLRKLSDEEYVLSKASSGKLFRESLPRGVWREMPQRVKARLQEVKIQLNSVRALYLKELNNISAARKAGQRPLRALGPHQRRMFCDLIASNDRKGVVTFLREHLPWNGMEPFERTFWESHLQSILEPSRERILVYRGLGGVSLEKRAGGSSFTTSSGIFAPVKPNSPNPVEFLVNPLGSPSEVPLGKDLKGTRPPVFFINNFVDAENNGSGLTISVSLSPSTAWSFGSGMIDGKARRSVVAIAIDKDRLFPNAGNAFGEAEGFVPLVIFPDEIISYYYAADTDRVENEQGEFRSFIQTAYRHRGSQPNQNGRFVKWGTSDFDKWGADHLVGLFFLPSPSPQGRQLPVSDFLNTELESNDSPSERLRLLRLEEQLANRPVEWNGTTYKAGQTIDLNGLKVRLIKFVDSGLNGDVYQVMDEDRRLYALKIALDQTPGGEGAKKFRSEVNERMPALERSGVKTAMIVKHDKHYSYILKEWVSGLPGEKWVQRWHKAGGALNFPGCREMLTLFAHLSSKGVYVNDLRPQNLIWSGKEWMVIDAGYVKKGIRPVTAANKYKHTIETEWADPNQPWGGTMFCQMKRFLRAPNVNESCLFLLNRLGETP